MQLMRVRVSNFEQPATPGHVTLSVGTLEVVSMRLVWTLACGAAIAIVIGFVWGGWTTAGATQNQADEAVLAARAAICVAQFMKNPSHEDTLKTFKETSSWERVAFIEKGGWDKMPGETQANSTVSRACADGLDILTK